MNGTRPLSEQFKVDVPWNYDPRLQLCERAGKDGLWLQYRLPTGKRRYVRASDTRRIAEKQARRKLHEIENGLFDRGDVDQMPELGFKRLLLAEAVDKYYELQPPKPRKGKLRKASAKTRDGDEPCMRVLFEALQLQKDGSIQHVDQVTAIILQKAIADLKSARGFSGGTGLNYIKISRKMFHRFKHHGFFAGDNPADGIAVDWEEDRRDVFVPPEHLALILRTPVHKDCTVPLKELIMLLAGTGMRTGEALHLEWFDIDFEQRQIKLRSKPNTPTCWGLGWKPKWGKERTVPMPDVVAEVLANLPRRSTSGKMPDGSFHPAAFVFPRKATPGEIEAGATEYVRCDRVNKMFWTHLKAAGLEKDGVLQQRFGMPKGTYHLYDLRRTYNTFGKEKAGFTMQEATRLLGNSAAVNERHYSPFVGDGAAAKVNMLADFLFARVK